MTGPVNILLVDDKPQNLSVLESILEGPDYRLTLAQSAQEALLALVANDYALIVLDVRMPETSGFELAQMIKGRKKTKDVPIVFLSAHCRRYLEVISGAAKHMSRLIEGLLAVSRLGRAEIRRSAVKLDELLKEVLQELERDINARNIAWEISPLPEIRADRALLKVVWTNLISNAVKYTCRREPAEIRIGWADKQGEFEFFVRDNGAGFDMRHSDKLFGVFQRLHHPDEFEGTGIGLANVRRIITRHGGRTWDEGKVGEGATFYFALPKSANP